MERRFSLRMSDLNKLILYQQKIVIYRFNRSFVSPHFYMHFK